MKLAPAGAASASFPCPKALAETEDFGYGPITMDCSERLQLTISCDEQTRAAMTDFLTARFRKSDKVVSRRIENNLLLVPIHCQASDIDGFYRLNEVGSEIWEHIDGYRSVADIIDFVVSEFDVTAETAEHDVTEFLEQLREIPAIEEVEASGSGQAT